MKSVFALLLISAAGSFSGQIASAQTMGYHAPAVTEESSTRGFSSSNYEDYSAMPLQCARDAVISALEHKLIKGYAWTKVHVSRGMLAIEGEKILLRASTSDNDNTFSFKYTASVRRLNSSDRSEHPVSGDVEVSYNNTVDSSYHGSYCTIVDEHSQDRQMSGQFDETGADALTE